MARPTRARGPSTAESHRDAIQPPAALRGSDVPRPVRAAARRDRPGRLRSRGQTAGRPGRHVLPRRPRLPVSAARAQYSVRRRRAHGHVSLCEWARRLQEPLHTHAALQGTGRGARGAVRHLSQSIHRRPAREGIVTRHREHRGDVPPWQADGIQGRQSARGPGSGHARDARRLLHIRRQAHQPHIHGASEDRFRDRRDDRFRLRGARRGQRRCWSVDHIDKAGQLLERDLRSRCRTPA